MSDHANPGEGRAARSGRAPVLRRRFVSLTEYGLSSRRLDDVVKALIAQRSRVEGRSRALLGTAHLKTSHLYSCAFDLCCLGVSDLVSVHALSDIRFLAALNDAAPVLHQRTTGAFVSAPGVDDLERFIDLAQKPIGGKPAIYAIVHLKLDTVMSLAALDLVVPRLLQRLARELRPNGVVLRGLDTSEIVVLVRRPTIESLGTLARWFFGLRLEDLPLSADSMRQIAGRLEQCGLHAKEQQLERAPLVLYSHTTLGLPYGQARALVRGEVDSGTAHTPVGTDVSVFRHFKMNPIPGWVWGFTDEHQAMFEGEDRPRLSFGSHHLVVSRTGEHVTLEEFARMVLGLDEVLPAPEGAGCFYRRRTLVSPTPQRTARLRASPDTALREQLIERLERARESFVSPPPASRLISARRSWFVALRNAAREHQWPYPTTNAALSLTLSMTCLLTDPDELENYLDLVRPFVHWLRSSIEGVGLAGQPSQQRLFRHLDRVMQARGHRESPNRPPAVTRAFESRAGQVLPRDVFNAYLQEVSAAILGCEAPPPLLIDGSDPELRVKVGADGAGIFLVSPLRLHQPILWPMIAHEVAHVRFNTQRFVDGARDPEAVLDPLKPFLGSTLRFSPQATIADVLAQVQRLARMNYHRDDPLRSMLPVLEEIAADTAVFDAEVLGPDDHPSDRLCRFAAAYYPNLTTDSSFPAPTDERRNEQLAPAAHALGFRMAFALALSSVDPEVAPGAAARDLLARVSAILREPKDLAHRVWRQTMGAPRFVRPSARGRPSEIPVYTQDLVEAVRTRIIHYVEGDDGALLVGLMGLLQALRRRPDGRVPDRARRYVADYLVRCLPEESASDLHIPKVRYRGGLESTALLGQRSLAELPEFYENAVCMVRESRASAFRELGKAAEEIALSGAVGPRRWAPALGLRASRLRWRRNKRVLPGDDRRRQGDER